MNIHIHIHVHVYVQQRDIHVLIKHVIKHAMYVYKHVMYMYKARDVPQKVTGGGGGGGGGGGYKGTCPLYVPALYLPCNSLQTLFNLIPSPKGSL